MLNEAAADLNTAGDNLRGTGQYFHRRAEQLYEKIRELEGKVIYEP